MILNTLWETFIFDPILNLMIYFYHVFGNNMFFAILVLTLLLKFITYPITKSSFDIAKKQKELKPELDKLKEQYPDKQEFAKKQMEFYKERGINPFGGCLPQLIPLVIFFTLYSVFRHLLSESLFNPEVINSALYSFNYTVTKFSDLNNNFLIFDLGKRDATYILPVLAGVLQYIQSKQMMSASKGLAKPIQNTEDKSDDFAYNMQQQMTYMLPIMTFIISTGVVSGLTVYIIISILFSMVQYYLINKD